MKSKAGDCKAVSGRKRVYPRHARMERKDKCLLCKKEQDFLERKRRRGLENVICFGLRRYAA